MTAARTSATADAALDALVAAAAVRCLGGSAGTIPPDVPLSLLGLDSLSAVELAADLEATLGRPVPDNLLEECSDLRAVADRLRELPSEGRPPADPFERMLEDAVLPDDVRPRQRGARGTSLQEAGSILLTGATGFLGSWLARELLLTTNATLYCVVRQKGALNPPERLRTALLAARLDSAIAPQVWRPSSAQPCTREAGASSSERGSRVWVVEADMSRPRLGLSCGAYDELAGSVDVICHAGAAVNWVYSYEGLRSQNVIGTLELLRLACHQHPLPLHFVSSLSVCYSTTGERQVDEALDPLREIRGVHLGYAQTKAVAEALVLEAGRRGLPIHVYRPGLIAGDSVGGAFNRDDLLSTLVRGCIHMGTAPDLDWTLDCQPVDWVARALIHLSGAPGPVFHLAHTRPRHWRECALWMRLFGYPLRLVPYHAWLRQLDTATSSSPGHPLRALRDFFLDARPGTGGLTLPQLYEDGRRARAHQARTDGALGGVRCECPPLDAALLDTYFGAFIAAGEIAPPAAGCPSDWKITGRDSATEADRAAVSRASLTLPGEAAGGAAAAAPRSASGSRNAPPAAARVTHAPFWLPSSREGARSVTNKVGPLLPLHGSGSIIGELASWRSSRPTGLFSTEVDLSATERCPAIVKIKARDEDAVAVGEALAHLCDPAVGEMYSQWRDRVGLTASHVRELAIYSQNDPRFVRHAPAVFGVTSDPASGTWLVALERIEDAAVMDAADCRAVWDDQAIAAVIDGLGALHAIWYGRERELCSREWIGHTSSTASMVEMRGLWTALAAHAAPAFSSWAGPVAAIQRRLIAGIAEWWPLLERQARTLIHNDFTPRNICLRGRDGDLRLCAYDWELATLGAPLRDLVEFLCFVLPADTSGEAVEHWVAQHRRSVEQYAGVCIDPAGWREAFPAALSDMLINRLGMYALIHRVRRQAFLPDVVRTWRRLYELYPLEGTR